MLCMIFQYFIVISFKEPVVMTTCTSKYCLSYDAWLLIFRNERKKLLKAKRKLPHYMVELSLQRVLSEDGALQRSQDVYFIKQVNTKTVILKMHGIVRNILLEYKHLILT